MILNVLRFQLGLHKFVPGSLRKCVGFQQNFLKFPDWVSVLITDADVEGSSTRVHPRKKRLRARVRVRERSMWLQVFMNCLLPLKSVLCAVRSHNCRWRWAMRKLSKVLRDHRAQKLRHDRIKFKVLHWQETVLCLFTVVNVVVQLRKRGNKQRNGERNPNRNVQIGARWDAKGGEGRVAQ